MRFRSRKREQQYRERRTIVVHLLEEFPICQRCHSAASIDVHEVIRRSQWSDGFLVRDNLRALCRACHTWITEHPAEAAKEGFSDWSWNRDKYLRHVEGMPDN